MSYWVSETSSLIHNPRNILGLSFGLWSRLDHEVIPLLSQILDATLYWFLVVKISFCNVVINSMITHLTNECFFYLFSLLIHQKLGIQKHWKLLKSHFYLQILVHIYYHLYNVHPLYPWTSHLKGLPGGNAGNWTWNLSSKRITK